MKEEVTKLIEIYCREYKASKKPELKFFMGDFEVAEEVSSQIIELFEKNKMTYEESYAILSFTYEALKYKSNNVHL